MIVEKRINQVLPILFERLPNRIAERENGTRQMNATCSVACQHHSTAM